jgi:hypothetical protein
MISGRSQSRHSMFTAARWSGKTVDGEYRSTDVSVQTTAMKTELLSVVETGREDLCELHSTMQILRDSRHPHLPRQDSNC